MIRPALLAVLLCTGCAETVSATPIVPPHRSDATHAWQQFCEQAWNVPQASALVAARGAEGWELVAMYNGALCYKRPLPDAAPVRPQPVTPASPGPAGAPGAHDPGF